MYSMPQPNNCTPPAAGGKLQGAYPQKQDGLFMQRVKVLGGRITWHQWRTVARLAALYTPGTPLHLTTRQNIEFHNVAAADLPAIQRQLGDAGLSMLGAGGDSVRNITVCTGCERSAGVDVFELARYASEQLASDAAAFDLPRKFKISFSGCGRACAKPFINDLGFVLQEDGGFTLIGAGSLGPRPAPGIELYRDSAVDRVLPLCKAAIQLFSKLGDRQNRRRARLRHIRERLGDDMFKGELNLRFKAIPAHDEKQEATASHLQNELYVNKNRHERQVAAMQLPNGNISSEDAFLLADFAEPLGFMLRINLLHGVELFASGLPRSPDSLPAMPAALERFAKAPTVVACPGCSTCPNGLVDCHAMAEGLRRCVPPIHNGPIHVSGCPNDCAQCAVAEVGLVGVTRTIDGRREQCYRVLLGGGNGATAKLATETAVVPADSVIEHLLQRPRA